MVKLSSTLNTQHINAAVILIYNSSPATFMFVSRPFQCCSPSIHHIPSDDPFFLHRLMIPPLHSPVPALPRQPCGYLTSPPSLRFCQFIPGCLVGLLPFVIFEFLWLLPVNRPVCLSFRTWASETNGRCFSRCLSWLWLERSIGFAMTNVLTAANPLLIISSYWRDLTPTLPC